MADFVRKRRKESSDESSINHQQTINAPKSGNGYVYEFGDFRLDGAHLMLYKDDEAVSLKPKAVETLLALMEKSGEIVSKDELMNRVWSDSFVEEANLVQNIYILRKTLGKASNGERLIETFWRRGYRFNGEIHMLARDEAGPATRRNGLGSNGIEPRTADASLASSTGRKRKSLFPDIAKFAFGGLLILTAFAFARFFAIRSGSARAVDPRADLKMTRFAPDTNSIVSEFTPDGKSLIYTRFENGKYSVWLKELATGAAKEILPPTVEGYDHPRLSQNGDAIYYITGRRDRSNMTLVRVSFTEPGKEPVEIVSNVIGPVAFSPDEKQITFINGDDHQVHIARIDGTDERVLATRDLQKGWFESWGSRMSWSPDGTKIAICGGWYGENRKRVYELTEIDPSNGSQKPIPTRGWNYVDDVQWIRDGTGFIVLARETEAAPFQLWLVSYPDGVSTRITNDTNDYDDVALSPDSRYLATNQRFQNTNLWLADVNGVAKSKQLTFGSNASDGSHGVAFTPDGRIVYASLGDSSVDLWMMNADGSEQRQLTKDAGDWNGRPQVTLDGRYVVFVSNRSGAKQIWRMDADGSNATQLTDVLYTDYPNVSPDGAWIYFSLEESDRSYIAKIPIDGGQPVRVSRTPNHAARPSISPDGRLIFYETYEEGSARPWKMALMAADTGLQIKAFESNFRGVWTDDSASLIYFMADDSVNLFKMALDGSKRIQLTNFENENIRAFAISRDQKQLVLSRGTPSSEPILLENFSRVP